MRITLICLTILAATILVCGNPEPEAEASGHKSHSSSGTFGRVILRKREKPQVKPAPKNEKCGTSSCKKMKAPKKKCHSKTCEVEQHPRSHPHLHLHLQPHPYPYPYPYPGDNGSGIGGDNNSGGGNNGGNIGGTGSNNGNIGNNGQIFTTPSSQTQLPGQTLSPTDTPTQTTTMTPAPNSSATKNYCNFNCGNDVNTGCNNTNTLKSTCPQGASQVTFNANEQQLILDEHNGYRNAIANGSNTRFSKAARMGKLVWNNDLAYLACLVADTCVIEHDKCRNTDQFQRVGQNLGTIGSSPNEPDTNDAIRGIIQSFYNENKDATMSDINSFNGVTAANGNEIGHFTQIVWSNATAVGCCATRYPQNGFNNFYMACDYTVGNAKGLPVYLTSDTAGSGCITGTDSTYPALCSSSENLDPNFVYQA